MQFDKEDTAAIFGFIGGMIWMAVIAAFVFHLTRH